MKVLMIIGSIVFPILMYFAQKRWKKLRTFLNWAAVIAALVFGNITSLSVYQIIKDKTVMMTNIHAVFLNPFFLISGAYLGVYIIYWMLKVTLEE
ncbi:transposase [Virgibacillus ihumii]|uniref:transposase n=1 Tax=Virgibacillus ihumii TaxID=2686091 RepID=UPI00157D4FA1|nr:transposase [Virgibacillus ihumii]